MATTAVLVLATAGVAASLAAVARGPARTMRWLSPQPHLGGSLLRPPADLDPEPVALEARVERAHPDLTEETFPTLLPDGSSGRRARWRVVQGTGNPCENYLASSLDGTLYDLGGAYLKLSEDRGRTWYEVTAQEPLITPGLSEGAVAVAPGGDVVAVAWSVAGDVLVPFKYDAGSETWSYSVTRLQKPFFDRPQIAVLPGPFQIAGEEIPYISMIRGGGFYFQVKWLYSLDGLTYGVPYAPAIDSVPRDPDEPPVRVRPWPQLDAVQPHEMTGVTPTGPGSALLGRGSINYKDNQLGSDFKILHPQNLEWRPFAFREGGPSSVAQDEELPSPPFVGQYGGRLLADSSGRLHFVRLMEHGILYLSSTDGGRTWASQSFDLPQGLATLDDEDFEDTEYYASLRANGALRTSVVAVHAWIEGTSAPPLTRDLVFRFRYTRSGVKLERTYFVGAGDHGATVQGTGGAEGCMDFPSVALLPDGAIAVSFTDARRREPSVAVELDPPLSRRSG